MTKGGGSGLHVLCRSCATVPPDTNSPYFLTASAASGFRIGLVSLPAHGFTIPQHWFSKTTVPSALRTELTTGPGPEGGGSKNSISRPHWPEKSGTGEPLSAAIAGETNAAAKKTNAIGRNATVLNAIVQAENRRGDSIRIPDIGPSLLERFCATRS